MIVLANKNSIGFHPTDCDIYIGRGSTLGNPFSHLSNSKAQFIVKSRSEAIAKYHEWLSSNHTPEVTNVLSQIKDKNLSGICRLICFCAPLPCHGSKIREEVWRRYGLRVAVIGSRSITDKSFVEDSLCDLYNKFPHIKEVVSGGAKGPDSFGEEWAKSRNILTKIFLPQWDKFGKRAGFIRNEDIVKNSDVVFAFWDGKSNGTLNSINLAKQLDIPVRIFTP